VVGKPWGLRWVKTSVSFTANITQRRHPERAPARRSFGSGASRNGQKQAPWRAGIYEEICTDSSIQRNIFVLLGVLREGKVSLLLQHLIRLLAYAFQRSIIIAARIHFLPVEKAWFGAPLHK